jgi:hypothetical protein
MDGAKAMTSNTSGPQATVLFCVTDKGNSVCLSWNKQTQQAEFIVQLDNVSVQPTSLASNTVSVHAEIPLDSYLTAREMACWIITNINTKPLEPFPCPAAVAQVIAAYGEDALKLAGGKPETGRKERA